MYKVKHFSTRTGGALQYDRNKKPHSNNTNEHME